MTIATSSEPSPTETDSIAPLVDRLRCHGQDLREHVFAAVLAVGDAAVPALAALTMSQDPDDLDGSWNALQLLVEMGTPAALEGLVAALAREPPGGFGDAILFALRDIGEAATDPALRAFRTVDDIDSRRALGDLLSRVGRGRDDVYVALCGLFREDPEFGAGLLAEFGDPRALELIHEAFESHEFDTSDGMFSNQAVFEYEGALRELAGTMSRHERALYRRAARRRERNSPALLAALHQYLRAHGVDDGLPELPPPAVARPAVAARRPGPNDPCSCGSGRKSKRCCG